MNPILLAIPVFLLSIGIEAWIAHRQGRKVYSLSDAIGSLNMGVLSQVSGLFTKLITLGIYAAVYDLWALTHWPMDSVWAWLYHAFLRIPLGTAFMEETAFRAVLPALFAVRWGVLRGCIAASALFGLWHVLPSLGLHKANATVTDVLGTGAVATAVTVTLAVVGTAITGLVWCWIRYRSGSVLATILGHVATNSVAYTIAFWVNR